MLYNPYFPGSCVGQITSSTTTYYGNSTALPYGSVSAGEFVSVLARGGGWAYIEYNASGGLRKRAFIPSGCVSCFSSNIADLYQSGDGTNYPVSSYITVYSEPSSRYPSIGTIYPSDNGQVRAYSQFVGDNGREMRFVSYPASGSTKYGYIYV